MLSPVLQIAGIIAVLAAVIALPGPILRWVEKRLDRRRAAHRPDPACRPIEAVAADVRRLGRSLALVPAGLPMARRRALVAAYDDVLAEAAQLLEIPNELRTTPVGAGRDAERLRVLAQLEAAGLVVNG